MIPRCSASPRNAASSGAAANGVTDRAGNAATVWSDGTPKAQTTPFDLVANALVGFDDRFAASQDYPDVADRKTLWRAARRKVMRF